MNSNKSNGNRFERELCKELAGRGFWAHNFAQSPAGQPADIIAVKGKTAWLIDCKVMSGKYLELSRVEPNQLTAMDLWTLKCECEPYFAVQLPEGAVRMVAYAMIQEWIADGVTRVDIPRLVRNSLLFVQWVEGVNKLC